MSFAHRSVLKEMREKKAKAAKAVERAVSRWRPWAESASSEPAPWPAKFGKGEGESHEGCRRSLRTTGGG